MYTILHKFDGVSEHNVRGSLKRFHLLELPRFLIIQIKRFSTNTQNQAEKNPTIVSFPIKNLDLRDFLLLPDNVDPNSGLSLPSFLGFPSRPLSLPCFQTLAVALDDLGCRVQSS